MKSTTIPLLLVSVNTLLMVITGCASQPPVAPASQPNSVDILISDHGRRVADATERMVRGLPKADAAPAVGSLSVDNPISMKWFGPVEPALAGLAAANGYGFAVIGKPPANPIIISASADASLWSDAIRGIGLQLGRRAEVVLDIGNKRVELHYVD